MTVPRAAHYCPMCGERLVQRQRQGALRPVCPACDHTVYFDPKVAVAVLIRSGASILLVQRANNPFQGYWTLPAGFMDYDEDPRSAGRREVEEETGLQVKIETLLDVFHTPDDGGLADVVIVYAASISGGTLQANDDASDARWFTLEDVPPVAFLPTQTIVRRWRSGEL